MLDYILVVLYKKRYLPPNFAITYNRFLMHKQSLTIISKLLEKTHYHSINQLIEIRKLQKEEIL